MRLKNPGWDLAWITPLWVIAGSFLAYTSVREGSAALGVLYGSLALCSLLVWFDMKWVATPLMMYFSMALLGAVVLLFVRGFSWSMILKIALAAYTIYAIWEWSRRQEIGESV